MSAHASRGGPLDAAPPATTAAAPWSRAERVALAIFAAAVLASLVWLVHPWYDATNDGSMYIACARSLLAGEGYTYLGEPFRIRPPGLSLLIAPVLALRGTDFGALNLLMSLFGAAAVVLLYLLQRERIGWVPALAVAAAVWLNPGWQRSCNQVMSETAGVALMLAALLVERWAARAPTAGARLRRELWLGAAIAAAAYVRTVNVLLLPAILLARLMRQAAARQAGGGAAHAALRFVPAAAVALLLVAPWSVRNRLVAPPPPATQTFLYSYATGMWHEDAGDPGSRRLGLGEVLGRVPRQAGLMLEVLGSRMRAVLPLRTNQLARGAEWTIERERGPAVIAAALVLLAGALYTLVKRREPADVFCWAALSVIAVYFGFDDRLLMPVFVLALPAAVELVRDLCARAAIASAGGPRAAAALAAAGVLFLAGADLAPRAEWKRIERQHAAFRSIAAAAAPRLAPDARVAAPIGWHYAVYLERDVHSLQWAGIRADKEGRSSAEATEELIDRAGVDTVLLSPLVPIDGVYLPYFERRYGARAAGEPALVVRVR